MKCEVASTCSRKPRYKCREEDAPGLPVCPLGGMGILDVVDLRRDASLAGRGLPVAVADPAAGFSNIRIARLSDLLSLRFRPPPRGLGQESAGGVGLPGDCGHC